MVEKLPVVNAKVIIDRILNHFESLGEQELMAYCYILQSRLYKQRIALVDLDFRLYGNRPYSHIIPVCLRELIFAGYIERRQGSLIFRSIRPLEYPRSYKTLIEKIDRQIKILKEEIERREIDPVDYALKLYNQS